MSTVNIHEAKTHFSRLLERVREGETVIIAKAGTPIAKLTAWEPDTETVSIPGGMENQGYWIADDFDDSIEDLFEQPSR